MILSDSSSEILFPLMRFLCFHFFLKNGLNRWSKQIEDSVFLVNGQVKDEDTELLEGQVSAEQEEIQLCGENLQCDSAGDIFCTVFIDLIGLCR